MTREQFKRNLIQSIERKDQYVSNEDIEKFLDLNFDEDSSISDWDFGDFSDFVSDLCNNSGDFWETVSSYDLHCPDKHYKVRTNYIDYCIEDFEVEELIRERYTEIELEELSEDGFEELKESILDEIISELPQVLEYEVECQEDELDDILCDWISSETGYFINEFDYRILEEN